MSFQPSRTETVKTLFHGNRFIIPKYQRKYSWRFEQRKALFDDIMENLKLNHFIGTLCFHKSNHTSDLINDCYEIIDGQQRITTLFILLNVLIEKLPEGEIKSSYLQLYIGEANKPKLVPLGNDQDFIEKLIFNYKEIKDKDITTRSQRFLLEAKRDYISMTKSFSNEKTTEFINYIAKKIELLIFNVEDQAQAVKMFTVINDRGLPLSNFDKTKSTLILYSTIYLDEELNQFINESFGQIFDYLDNALNKKEELQLFRTLEEQEFENTFYTHHYYSARFLFEDWDYQLGANSIFIQLKRRCESLKDNPGNLKKFISDYTNDLLEFSKSYSNLFDEIPKRKKYIQLFQYLEFTATLYPFIIRINQQNRLNNFLKILETTEVRIYKLKNTNPRRFMYQLSSEIMEEELSNGEIFSKLREFNTNFLNDYRLQEYLGDIVDQKTGLIRYIMYCINKEKFDQDLSLEEYRNLQVEHIFSVNPNFGIKKYGFGRHETYDYETSKIGNLVILEKKLNKRVSNLAPVDKTDGYQQSNLKIISDLLGQLGEFHKTKIESRNDEIIEFCLNRFKIN
ncbi:MAG: DUF262 domain-containing protein [Lewinellaceae bacterium]|nr:DUF262 domain-containing protein [Lewinellaceae bacterium]